MDDRAAKAENAKEIEVTPEMIKAAYAWLADHYLSLENGHDLSPESLAGLYRAMDARKEKYR